MSKKQVWFRPDQLELVVESLKYMRRRCGEDHGKYNPDSLAAEFAKTFTVHRIDEIIRLFGEEP